MIKNLIIIAIGIVFILAGIFRWYPVLAFFTFKFKPETNADVWVIRGVSVMWGICLIMMTIQFNIL